MLFFSRGTVNENSTALLTVSVVWLITGFISHLLLRSVWAAFIGLSYVYGEGVKLHRLKLGPRFRRHLSAQLEYEPSNKIWIPSARVEGQLLEAFVVHRTVEEEALIKPSCDYDSLSQVESVNLDSLKLACLKQFYQLKIDGQHAEAEMYYLVNRHTLQDGLMSYVDISELPRGGHALSLHYRFYSESAGKILIDKIAELEFYKESPAEDEPVSAREVEEEAP